eukprot:CAMPEP_0171343922 /NCGR_PEP_ID=MMETSP0878-20121228/18284_1 /TAXON_ID=67004 /ORGANISM="Thalassiosira weissflogii, Strain CCMP1336" /LENGTH=521 /DNA_ID=CAMNT_0011846979 /DNA_START=21 /DNA_END=1586 /DNA_ORIENTATION=-
MPHFEEQDDYGLDGEVAPSAEVVAAASVVEKTVDEALGQDVVGVAGEVGDPIEAPNHLAPAEVTNELPLGDFAIAHAYDAAASNIQIKEPPKEEGITTCTVILSKEPSLGVAVPQAPYEHSELVVPQLEDSPTEPTDDHDNILEPQVGTNGKKKESSAPKKYKRRICRFPDCTRTVKSQGHCQKHGAKAKRCKFPDCNSQAQGSHNGYCKRHWREFEAPESERRPAKKKTVEEPVTCDPVGFSVYDEILPLSFAWKTTIKPVRVKREISAESEPVSSAFENPEDEALRLQHNRGHQFNHYSRGSELIPIAQHLADNAHLEPGWHRKNERLARGLCPPKSISSQLDTWEKQLAILEISLITGTFNDVGKNGIFRHHRNLAHAWGREKGFHKIILEQLCDRRGDLERKKRSDTGKKMTQERKRRPKEKLQQEKENKSVKYNTRSESQDEKEAMTEEAINMAVEAAAYATVAATAANEYLQEDTLTHPPSIEPASIEELIDQRVHEHHDQVEDQQQQVPDTVEI